MPETDDWVDRFVGHLEELRDRENRGALAALRRGAGSPPGTIVEMYPEILPWVPNGKWAEDPAYVVGALFALHPQPGGRGNIGTAFAMVKEPSESLERRFVALLNSHRDDLPGGLRHAVALLKSKDVPIDWRRLLSDILQWDHESRFVQRKWAREFWQTTGQSTS